LRPGEPTTVKAGQQLLYSRFFDPKRYDLGRVGRYKINKRLGLNIDQNVHILTPKDVLSIVNELINFRIAPTAADDIDHLGNRRVRTVGEQLANQFNIALSRMQRNIREKMNQREAESLTPQDLINSRIVTTVLNTFFGTSQLSQFMDQTNPLSEITHKRRVSALGPGGFV
jgi:DNA-directed RNA polymerase subunit beta